MKITSLIRIPAAAFAALVLACSSVAHASTTWDGNAASTAPSWGTAANWSDDVAPTFNNATQLSFPTSAVTNFNTTLGNPRTIRSMTFGANVDSAFGVSFTVSGTASSVTNLTMGGGVDAPTIAVDADSTGPITIGNPFGLASTGTMVLAGNLGITHNGTGLLNFNRAITGGFGITKAGSGTMMFNSVGAAPNTFSGALNINEGRVIANGFVVATDINNASSVNLAGGALEVRSISGANKDYTVGVNVTGTSSLVYSNTVAASFSLTFSGSNAFAVNSHLTLQNASTNTGTFNQFNITRNITGTSTATLNVETYNNLSAITDNFTNGRVQLSGTNSGYNGNVLISKGTLQLNAAAGQNTLGNGILTIGSGTAGAGLTFNAGSDQAIANNIVVAAGGFRAIKNNSAGGAFNIAFNGAMTLNGDLTIDQGLGNNQTFTLGGDISGAGGITIARPVGTTGSNAGSTAVMSGSNTYLGDTTITSGSLILNGSLTSNILVSGSSRFGGDGSTTGNLSLAAGAQFVFNTASTLDVTGTVTLDNTFSVASLVNANGTAVNWTSVGLGTYALIGTTTSDFSNITNFGLANAADLGGGKSAYFRNGSLELVVIPEPTTWALLAAGLTTVVALRRRRRC